MTALGDELREKMQAEFDEFDVPAQVTGIGSLFGGQLHRPACSRLQVRPQRGPGQGPHSVHGLAE